MTPERPWSEPRCAYAASSRPEPRRSSAVRLLRTWRAAATRPRCGCSIVAGPGQQVSRPVGELERCRTRSRLVCCSSARRLGRGARFLLADRGLPGGGQVHPSAGRVGRMPRTPPASRARARTWRTASSCSATAASRTAADRVSPPLRRSVAGHGDGRFALHQPDTAERGIADWTPARVRPAGNAEIRCRRGWPRRYRGTSLVPLNT